MYIKANSGHVNRIKLLQCEIHWDRKINFKRTNLRNELKATAHCSETKCDWRSAGVKILVILRHTIYASNHFMGVGYGVINLIFDIFVCPSILVYKITYHR